MLPKISEVVFMESKDMKIDFKELHFEGAPNIVSEPPSSRSKELISKQRKYEGNAVSYSRGIPIAFEEGKGATLKDADGNIYIDMFGGAGVLAAGRCNPLILEEVKKQQEKLIHTLDLVSESRENLSELLVKNAPNGLVDKAKVIFGGPTGSDAVEAAVKLAKINTKKSSMISFEGGYHGMTGVALSLTGDTGFKKEDYMPMGQSVQFTPYAYCYRCPFGFEKDNCDLACTKYLENLVTDPGSGITDLTGIIMEPVQGEGGSIVPPDGFLKEVRRIADENSIPLIIDEIQSGLGRTGELFACEKSGITPDIMTFSKAIGGGIGYPLSGILYDEKYDIWEPGSHIGTFRGFLPAMAAGVAYFKFVEQNNLLQHVKDVGNHMLDRLKEMKDESKIIGDVRGRGLIQGVELVKNKETKEPDKDLASDLRKECVKRGVLIEVGGHYHNVARFLPPLVLTKELADKALDKFEESIREIEK